MTRITAGIVAHVDAGKTTLSEALLYRTGEIRTLGRVDHGDAFLDTDSLEKARGITIFAHQALVEHGDLRLTLLDTPGHVDFAAETERVLRVLDYAILVVSGTDGVQGYTETLWRLLARYRVPVFLFVNKCDAPGFDRDAVLAQLRRRLSDAVVPLPAMGDGASDGTTVPFGDEVEDVAALDESAMEEYFDAGGLTLGRVRAMIAARELFPVFFGSALKLEGVEEFLDGFAAYAREREWPAGFGARVFKISHDDKHNRLTWLRVTGGTLRAKSLVRTGDGSGSGTADAAGDAGTAGNGAGTTEKIDQVRVYNGAKFDIETELPAGSVCAVTGLEHTFPGEGLGAEPDAESPAMQPVLTYTVLPAGAGGVAVPSSSSEQDRSPAAEFPRFDDLTLHKVLTALRELEDEDPLLHVVWVERVQEIHVQLMGAVQLEIIQQTLHTRFGLDVSFGPGSILYRETITEPIEGVGHFEPLRHYAEAHILIEPGEPGSGVHVASALTTNELDRNWQRLILTHLTEREHLGVLTGSPLTDVRMTLVAARAHLKHTEGGDFRQATYRAIRQGLMEARAGVAGHAVVGKDTQRPAYEIDDESDAPDGTSPEPSGKSGKAGGTEADGTATTNPDARAEAVAAMVKAVAADPGNCVVLEPWYRFRLEVPDDMVGRAMADIQRMSGTFDPATSDGEYALIEGSAPVAEMRDYAMDVNAYTHGRGRFSATFGGYRPCHDQARVIEEAAYDPESDLEHTPDSVFCAHGAGYPVKWYKVPEFMHVDYATA
ncbi:TetM/TetW/TetO/TetS family tetracycline resistance ribosomal protection protein [Bifidobacterium sp. MA2]|uniref:TetM/TetW/TetO/TetS family tetracycline resistance ribosomal protection protein n=1 Tax=Bifidobacterium santillanense TaxID=2809028 RepID=A0ABS5UNF4_9BIFI|nr:TetM/TetW/TetO/TetS family tetracycline resistance ribosomal protection protein [Bifidobacterium santillanense]MBT1172445.1 TetM/TetW/TetO/TetS family tetracycline resistance ribosomal protection protein [Bifidobacterium santillanense]